MDKCPTCGHIVAHEIVELAPAYMWDCPNCGRENFQRSITLAITDEDRAQMGLDLEEDGCWQSYPNVVVCKHCNTHYETRHIDEPEDEDEEDEYES